MSTYRECESRVFCDETVDRLNSELAAVTAERDRMRPGVEAALKFRRPSDTFFVDELNDAVDAYEATK